MTGRSERRAEVGRPLPRLPWLRWLLCWAGALTLPFLVMGAWVAFGLWAWPKITGEWLYGLPLPFLAGVGCLSLLPTTLARRVWLSLLLVLVLAVPLAYVGAYLVLWFGPSLPMF